MEGHPIPPMASDIEGGGKFVNRADEMICIHRYTQHETEWVFSHLHVRKVKDMESGGRPTPLENPIRLQSMKGNVGYYVGHKSLINLPKPKTDSDVPF